jgi:hypothetical protein
VPKKPQRHSSVRDTNREPTPDYDSAGDKDASLHQNSAPTSPAKKSTPEPLEIIPAAAKIPEPVLKKPVSYSENKNDELSQTRGKKFFSNFFFLN